MRLLVLMFLVACSGTLNYAKATDSLGRVNLITKLPFLVLLLSSESHGAGVWIPEAPKTQDPVSDGSVVDEYSEVATVFAKPEAKVVQAEVLPSDQSVPWTSLKQEWDLYKKFHASRNKKSSDEESSSEDSFEDEEDDEESSADEKLPQAFYGQQNTDDDERDFLHKENNIKRTTKKKIGKVQEESDEVEDDDDEPEAEGDEPNLDDIPDSVKQEMLNELIASGKIPQSEIQKDAEGESDEDIDEVQDELPSRKKGDDSDLVQDDKGKKGKGKKKKKGKKKGGHGWGWKKPLIIPIPPPKPQKGWKQHDGFLEQLVKGSTWERVLSYYHQKRDEAEDQKGWGWGWGDEQVDLGEKVHKTGEKLVDKLFKGSFWDRAFQTYQQYKNDNVGKPNKEYANESPLSIDW